MAPRGSGGLNFNPLITHLVFLFTIILAVAGWWAAFIGQIIATNAYGDFGGGVGTLWFAIFLQLAVILGVCYTLASDTIGMHRLQISAFAAVALVFSVEGCTTGLFSLRQSEQAFGAGWLLLTISNVIWLLYFTSEEDSLIFHIINQIGGGTGGLTPPSRNRRRNPSVHGGGMGAPVIRQASMGNGGYSGGMGGGGTYQSGGIGSGFDNGGTTEAGLGGGLGTPRGGSMAGGAGGADTRSNRSGAGGPNVITASPAGGASPRTPLMAAPGGAGHVSGGDPDTSGQALTSGAEDTGYAYRARALYAYTASPDDPNEISFAKGEILDIVDNAGKWWQAKKADGATGIAPSNYLQII